MEEILGAHPIGDGDFWDGTNLSDVSIDAENSKEIMTSSHITEQHTHKYQGPVPPELLNVTPNKPQSYDLHQNYQLDSPKQFKGSNILPKTCNVTKNVSSTSATNILSQEIQEYHNRRNHQYIACKYDDGLEQVTLELVPNIILEEEKDSFYQWTDNYDQWDNTSYTPVDKDKTGGFHTLNIDNCVFNITKTKHNGKSKTSIVSEVSESNNKSGFYIGKRQS